MTSLALLSRIALGCASFCRHGVFSLSFFFFFTRPCPRCCTLLHIDLIPPAEDEDFHSITLSYNTITHHLDFALNTLRVYT